jgi:predicted metal-dependent peptidase
MAARIFGHEPFPAMSETAVRLMLRVPYIMVLFYSIQFYVTKLVPTLAINGVSCWINLEFWNQLTRDQKLTAVAHEIGHKMLLHPTRRGSRDKVLWNMAGDYVINLMLVESGFAPLANLTIDGKPWSWLYDEQYRGMTTEQVYDLLLQQLDEEEEKERGKEPGEEEGESEGEEPGENGADDGTGEGDGDDTAGSGADDPDDGGDQGTGAADDEAAGTAEEEASGQCGAGGQSNARQKMEDRLGPMKDLLDFGTDPNGDSTEEEESPKDFEERMKQELNAAEAVAKMQGKLPGWMKRVMDNANHQKVPWPEIVEQFLKSMVVADYSWRRWSRREYFKLGILTPDIYQPAMGGMVLLVDCSGSIDAKQLGQFSGHFRDILEQVKPACVTVVYFDTQPYEPYDRFERAEFEEDTSRLKPQGGGGTDFRWFAQFIEEMEEQPEVCMCLTDMYGSFGRETPVPMLWLCNSGVEEAPYGTIVNIA